MGDNVRLNEQVSPKDSTANHIIYDTGIASQIGSYSNVMPVALNLQWLFTTGTQRLKIS